MNVTAIAVYPNPVIGAEIRGLDLSRKPTPAQLAAVQAAWREHLVLVFRNQRLSDRQLLDFSSLFGELDPPGPNPYGQPFHPEYTAINVISNIVENGRPQGNLGYGEAVWHADMTYIDRPPKGALLYALEIPPNGGNTYFADMYAAYDALGDDLKRHIHGKIAIHDASHNSAGMRRKGYAEVTDVRQTPGARHPLVRSAADGRKALFLGRRPRSYILGLEVEESERLLDALWAHATQLQFTMTHVWQVGDLLMWDNLAVLHKRDAFDPASRRRLHRTQLRGEQAIV